MNSLFTDIGFVSSWLTNLNPTELNSFVLILPILDRPSRIVRRRLVSDLVVNRVDFTNTTWEKLIRHPSVRDPTHRKGKVFRRRFRVPFPLFLWLVEKCKEYNLFELKQSAKSNPRIPVEIKLLCCLRLLGRGECADTIAELSEVGESTVNHLIHTFFKNFLKTFREEYIFLATGCYNYYLFIL